jgi:hypothetical protein
MFPDETGSLLIASTDKRGRKKKSKIDKHKNTLAGVWKMLSSGRSYDAWPLLLETNGKFKLKLMSQW